jgi:hypothetical protein
LDRWIKLNGEVPTGWFITADIRPNDSLIVLTTATKSDRMKRRCDELFLVRSTYVFQVAVDELVDETVVPECCEKILRRSIKETTDGTAPDAKRRELQTQRLALMPDNTWVLLADPGRAAPLRTWGSCAFDTDRGQLIYWGGGHCGYGGNDYDFYDVAEHTWISSPAIPDYPPRVWHRGINLAGVTFSGGPWVRHGRKIYAYDPVSKQVINTKFIYLTAGYNPELLRQIDPCHPDFGSGENFKMAGYTKWATWGYDREKEIWEIICSGHVGLDLTVSTPHGVLAVDYSWGAIDAADRSDRVLYEGKQVVENAVFLLTVADRQWHKLSADGPWPQNLYEMTALVYDSKRDGLILHGGGANRDELWRFDLRSKKWTHLEPAIKTPDGKPPVCRREAVYLPGEDALLTCGYPAGREADAGVYVYRVAENAWYRAEIAAPPGREMKEVVGQNRAMAYDPAKNLVLMVLGEGGGNLGSAVVYAMRFSESAFSFQPI